jgi:NhaA family Na+:H+ antiporter
VPDTNPGRIANAPLPQRLARPLEEFLGTETIGGVLLLVAAAVALLWANFGGDSYADFWSARIVLDADVISLNLTLVAWVNDALMAVFFFVVALEIKREFLRGELRQPRTAALPVAAAFGGMLVPAAIFYGLNVGSDGDRGWGIPMATDIAFAVGVLALLGRRVPASLRVFLLTLAIVDDLGAILVIAVFYTKSIDLAWLGLACALLGLTYVMGRAGVRDLVVYVAVAVVAWVAVHESGVHATIAGVAFGLITPIKPYFGHPTLRRSAPDLAALAAEQSLPGNQVLEDRHAALRDLEELARESQPVLDRLEHALHPWTSYVIVPIFALANAGIALNSDAIADAASSRVTLGIVLGLAIGKPVGIVLFSWLAVQLRLAVLPASVGWSQILGAGMIAGIGFTVSIFITDLAYSDAAPIEQAKLGILAASATMAVLGLVTLYLISRPRREPTTPVPAKL